MGGLATNTSSLLMGGNANFNLLSYKGVGMLEFSFGKDGIKSKIGMGGTNISIQNLRNVAAGYKEASKVTDWKYGSSFKRKDCAFKTVGSESESRRSGSKS